MKFLVVVMEGSNSDDIAHYYCNERPIYGSEPVEDSNERVSVLRFVPKNGMPPRVNRINTVPLGRVVAVVIDEEGRIE